MLFEAKIRFHMPPLRGQRSAKSFRLCSWSTILYLSACRFQDSIFLVTTLGSSKWMRWMRWMRMRMKPWFRAKSRLALQLAVLWRQRDIFYPQQDEFHAFHAFHTFRLEPKQSRHRGATRLRSWLYLQGTSVQSFYFTQLNVIHCDSLWFLVIHA